MPGTRAAATRRWTAADLAVVARAIHIVAERVAGARARRLGSSRWPCPVPSTYSVRLANIELSAGLMDDGRHDHPHPHRPPPRGQDPALPGVRKPRVAAPTGR